MGDHIEAKESLETFLKENSDKKVIIMTHMAPSSKSSHPKYGINNPLNFHYYSSLEDIVLDNPQIKVWVHGHTHDSHDYIIGDTRVICNPRGYSQSRISVPENEEFVSNYAFEV
jgi:Icc-related predicted phosphoesterase